MCNWPVLHHLGDGPRTAPRLRVITSQNDQSSVMNQAAMQPRLRVLQGSLLIHTAVDVREGSGS